MSMPGLKNLKVRLSRYIDPHLVLDLDEDWVKPMLQMRGLDAFELQVEGRQPFKRVY